MSIGPEKVAEAGKGIAAVLAAKKAGDLAPGNAIESAAISAAFPPAGTGATSSATQGAMLVPDRTVVIARPERPTAEHVLFVSSRKHLNFVSDDNKKYTFQNGYFMTNDVKVLEHLNKNKKAYRIVEVEHGELSKPTKGA